MLQTINSLYKLSTENFTIVEREFKRKCFEGRGGARKAPAGPSGGFRRAVARAGPGGEAIAMQVRNDACAAGAAAAAGGRVLELEDLLSIEYLSSPAASSELGRAWYVVATAERATGELASEVWGAALDGSGAAPVLPGAGFSQKLPRPGADGALYLLSDEVEPGVFQVWRVGADGARAQLTHLRHGVSWFSLSDDASTVAFEAPLWPAELADLDASGRGGTAFTELKGAERAAWERGRARAPVVVEDLVYKLDSAHGLLDGSVTQVGLAATVPGDERLLTRGEVPHLRPQVSPDGSSVACWCCPHGGWERTAAEVAVIDAATGDERVLTDSSAGQPDIPPVWTGPRTVAAALYAEGEGVPFHGSLVQICMDDGGAREPVELLGASDGDGPWGPGAVAASHTACGYPGEAVQRASDGSLLLLSAERSVAGVWPVLPGGGAGARLTPDRVCVQGFAAAGAEVGADGAARGILALIMGEPGHPAEPYALDLATGGLTLLAHHNTWLDHVAAGEPEELVVPSPRDGAPVHGWVLRPRGLEPGGRAPAVLEVRGGPECYTPYDWWFEFQYLAARGMAVVWCDPHGSVTHGAAFQEGAWDGTARDDLLAFLDAAIDLGFIDPARVGVTGGSYGGYMTNALISSTDRFAAAVSQRTLCCRATSYGTGDMGSLGGSGGCLDGLMDRLRAPSSTIRDIDRVSTPVLVLHGTEDYRCGFEQGEMLYHALRDRRPEVPARLCAFPGQNHGLTRDGNAWAQVGHLREMVAWFDEYLAPCSGAVREGAGDAPAEDGKGA